LFRTAILVFALPIAAHAEAPSVQADRDFQGLQYSLTSSGNIVTFAGARNIGGKLGVCGLVFFENATASTRALEKKFAEHIQFKIAGKAIHVETAYFTRYATKQDSMVGKAGCSVTTRAWDPVFAKAKLEMALPNQTIRF
jgi:hypothetical protein